ncbi:MAG TPA: ribbon-helix-helix protein, CopG family [Gemmatimonadaceae bacterium]|nr:ribbon-helix-helix protein, CopG family [Gemmatimonadaceae bacterium]
MRPRSLKLPPQLDALIDRLARERGTTFSAVVREAVQAYLAAPERSATAAAGELVGALRGPKDLSTSSGHLDGFGE